MTTPRNAFHYVSHPHEAYMAGHTVHMGGAIAFGQQYEAYNYYVPDTVVRTIPKVNDYFGHLIRSCNNDEKHWRYHTIYDWIDLAISLLSRVEHRLAINHSFLIGDQNICAVPWAVVGNMPGRLMIKNQFPTIESLVEHYVAETKEPCRTLPVSIYHKKGREWLVKLSCRKQYNDNQLLTTAILFIADVIRNAGPQTDVFYDVFTNDSRVAPDKVPFFHWNDARRASVLRSDGFDTSKKDDLAGSYVRTSYKKEEPRHWRVTIKEEVVGLYSLGKATKFGDIIDYAKNAAEYAAAMQEYYNDWM